MRLLFTFVVILLISAAPTTQARAKPVVLELFTSQGCYSCPPAEALLARLLEDDEELIALEFHVDYWDTLVYGSAGSWQDPFSDALYSARQRQYNQHPLDGRTGVYTPQIIVNGQFAVVGSQEALVNYGMERYADLPWVVNLERVAGTLAISLDESAAGAPGDVTGRRARALLAIYDRERTTEITAGENKGLTLTNHHVVRTLKPLIDINLPASLPLTTSTQLALGPEQGCAIVVQLLSAEGLPGAVLGAANCPR